ncbi:MAG: phosphotransferase family protein [Actinomycetia bacterium]|nr:phosphotransferase family protein [Actinomycetes bacterium]MCP4086161.1 phosphotransferase family protein [Actinomycetes bacterium]
MPGVTGLIEAERLSGGASQETYRLRVETDDGPAVLAMRRAPGGEAPEDLMGRPGLEVEAELMRIAGDHGVPEPVVHHVLQPADGIGPGFIMEWLEGEALGGRIVRSPDLADVRPHLAGEYGRILARIHAIDLDATGLRAKLTEKSTVEFIHEMWDRYKQYPTPQPMIDYAARWLLDHLPPERPLTLVHNDFRNGNVMVDPDGVVAVLDWEAAHIGDPGRDLGWLCTASWRFGSDLPVGGFGTRDQLLAGYEAESGVGVDPEEVRFWEVFGSFWWAVGCIGMAEHYRTGPDQSVERPAIGRRSSECQVDCVNLIIPGPVELLSPTPVDDRSDMPRADELLVSVRDFLRDDVMTETRGRTNFLARVAANSLDILLREGAVGPQLSALEATMLASLLDDPPPSASVWELRWQLVDQLRDATMPLDQSGLTDYLRTAVVNQVAIDQPRYPGLATALD